MSVPTTQEVESSSSSPQLSRRFTFSEIQLATQNLEESLVIGHGGFGKVYKGTITSGSNLLTAAIKRLDSTSNQGASEFWAEVNMLSSFRHCHLVSLIGYCNDEQEMILVYEYMSHGSLEDHLHKRQTPLSWMQRLTICIGAARGLDYLHTGTGIKHGVVHRDVKTTNILLHNSWEAKISDFGLSKTCPRNQRSTYVNTDIKGTFGYLDPDYFYTGKLTRKSDVYAFGVVLFEVLCGKQALDSRIEEEHWGLAIWAQDSIKEGRLKEIVDTNMRGVISPKCLKLFALLAKRCLHKHLKRRPTMAEVVVGLESIMALQEKANNTLPPFGMQFFAKKALTVMFQSAGKNSSPTGKNSSSIGKNSSSIYKNSSSIGKNSSLELHINALLDPGCTLLNWDMTVKENWLAGTFSNIIDPRIDVDSSSMTSFIEIGLLCLQREEHRPTMEEVVGMLLSWSSPTIPVSKMQARMSAKITDADDDTDSDDYIDADDSFFLLYFDTVGGENQTLLRFDFDDISVATSNFSEANKILQHTSDILYKGKLQSGRGIAVVERSYGTGLNLRSMNEASIMVKLEHENVAKLLGYCIEGTRLCFVYDFALHATLDQLIFDPKYTLLNWDKRYNIILGVARALLYLHRDAPVQIIHCDVNPGNILLDESSNPILSSFWAARCLAINETVCRKSRTFGTWGYMAPEYNNYGYLSTKTDVYSFGVLVLEIITGLRARGPLGTTGHIGNGAIGEYVKRSWFEGILSNIIDPRIDVDSGSMTRFFEIGLLCVQEDLKDRPTMEEVVSMLLDSSSLTPPLSKMRARMTGECSDDYDITAVEEFLSDFCPR
ncbi:hypothetical protein SSX86_021266 [Deinandra increscens subsp. villosa]|uniref:Protein kinase domain-containing protein n=1 Tax=Deinandra increscens subsp. villosa TaxID=3103831 RepID=A0AAP0CQZ7_9ASTR